MKVLYQCREVQLLQDDDEQYIVKIVGESGIKGSFSNPIEAWAQFVNFLDSRVRRRIGDMLEEESKNRYTGELIGGR